MSGCTKILSFFLHIRHTKIFLFFHHFFTLCRLISFFCFQPLYIYIFLHKSLFFTYTLLSAKSVIKNTFLNAKKSNSRRNCRYRSLFSQILNYLKNPFIISSSASFSVSPSVISFISCSPAIFPIAAS